MEDKETYRKLINKDKTIAEFNEKLDNYDNAVKIEESIFNYTFAYVLDNHKENYFVNIYEYKKNFLLGLDVDLNNQPYDLSCIAFLKPNELLPECYADIQAKIDKRNERSKKIEYSSVYVCKRCKQKKCMSKVICTRGLDENLTTVITCHNCGYITTE